jgi:hypothetical protein
VDIIVAQTPRLNKGVFAGSDAAAVKVCCLDAYGYKPELDGSGLADSHSGEG